MVSGSVELSSGVRTFWRFDASASAFILRYHSACNLCVWRAQLGTPLPRPCADSLVVSIHKFGEALLSSSSSIFLAINRRATGCQVSLFVKCENVYRNGHSLFPVNLFTVLSTTRDATSWFQTRYVVHMGHGAYSKQAHVTCSVHVRHPFPGYCLHEKCARRSCS